MSYEPASVCRFVLTIDILGMTVKKSLLSGLSLALATLLVAASAYAQESAAAGDTLTGANAVAAEVANEVVAVTEVEKPVEKPKYWTKGITTQIGFSQVGVSQWADGANQSLSLNSFIDAFANYSKDKIIWENRLQLAYGFVTDIDDRFTKKTDDKIQLDSKLGYNISKDLYLSAQYSFKTQFSNGYKYDGNSIVNKESAFLSPAYTNLALGVDYKPLKWLNVNFAPVTGGIVIVNDASLREKYGNYRTLADGSKVTMPVKFELGAQLKLDIKLKIGSSLDFASYLTLFSNYLDKPQNLRVTWDTVTDFKLNKFFSLNFRTYLIYDDKIMIADAKNPDAPAKQRVQFKEIFSIGFTYSFGV